MTNFSTDIIICSIFGFTIYKRHIYSFDYFSVKCIKNYIQSFNVLTIHDRSISSIIFSFIMQGWRKRLGSIVFIDRHGGDLWLLDLAEYINGSDYALLLSMVGEPRRMIFSDFVDRKSVV